MLKLKVGDQVTVIAGKDKGKKGKIEKIFKRENKIIIAGVNVYKRHRKATKNQGSGIYEFPRPLITNNVSLICPKCTKNTKVGFETEGKTKYRICKKCKGRLP